MTSIRFLLLALLPMFAGCQSLFPSDEPAPARAVRLQGDLHVVNNRLQFSPCQETRQFALEDSGNTGLLQETVTLLNGGKGVLFVDLAGHMVASKVAGTDGQINLTKLYRVQREGHGCDDLNFKRQTLRASGHEPDWRIDANSQGLILQRPGQSDLVVPYLEEQLPEGRFSLSSAANGQQLELWVTPQRCVDNMSGSVQHLRAELRINGQTLKGCGAYGGARQEVTLPSE